MKILTLDNFERDKIRQQRLKTINKITKKKGTNESLIAIPRESLVKNLSLCRRFIKTPSRAVTRNANVSLRMIDLMKKKSHLDVSSPTAKILENCTLYLKPKTTNSYVNINGFQPSNKNPSGIFKKIHERFKYIEYGNL